MLDSPYLITIFIMCYIQHNRDGKERRRHKRRLKGTQGERDRIVYRTVCFPNYINFTCFVKKKGTKVCR